MPYNVLKRGDVWIVQKKDGTKVYGRHRTEGEARQQQKALYASEKK